MSTRIMLTNVRLSFPDLFVARAFNASTEPKQAASLAACICSASRAARGV